MRVQLGLFVRVEKCQETILNDFVVMKNNPKSPSKLKTNEKFSRPAFVVFILMLDISGYNKS